MSTFLVDTIVGLPRQGFKIGLLGAYRGTTNGRFPPASVIGPKNLTDRTQSRLCGSARRPRSRNEPCSRRCTRVHGRSVVLEAQYAALSAFEGPAARHFA